MKNSDSRAILDRLKLVLSIKTDTVLAERLQVTQAAISAWRVRDSLDIRFILPYLPKGIDLNWLINGEGEDVIKAPPQIEESEILQELKRLRRDMKSMEKQVKNIKEELQRENEVEEDRYEMYNLSHRAAENVAEYSKLKV